MALDLFLHQFFAYSWPPRSAYTFNGVCPACSVPNFAIPLFRTGKTGLPGSFIVDVVGLIFRICNPGASTSYKPSKVFLERRLPCIFLANLSSTARSLRGIGRQTLVRRKRDWPFVLSHSVLWASCEARVIAALTSMLLR